ncbi:TetR/AcrR family transcriptional regulator C-terminal domain-containing protein [Clostridium sp.]|uniref:TetR/AcrR family transcriptional regulator C-terminal domain-containing protein n=1 Tax=Clostridium sp. TaxID=1506 RepID=UPI003D6CF5FF
MSNSQITKLALADAMKDLMEEKPLHKITISDITNSRMMNRKSFYYHFKDKYDLVNWIFYTDFVSAMQKTSSSDIWDLLKNICDYFYENKVFYCNALSVTGQNSFSDFFMEVIEPFMLINFGNIFEDHENKEFLSVYFSDATRVAITRWLVEDKDISPEKFVDLTRCAIKGIAIKVIEDTKED